MIIDNILDAFNRTQSIKATAKMVGCSWNRVVKILSSSGIIINDTHSLIIKMHDQGKTIEEIAEQTGYNVKTVQAYIPAVRPYYNVNISENAKRIKHCRKKKDC
ncbi:MAG: helix-turn-helix domain-containing protein [Lachnospiraceae bacterium]|nr:helix-turn-helix domain-containing protein [Lachnospiraceae bacterium]MDE7204049.1 helix-turn-helix domain-containing protein [Lachnospiraceae bacterium]